LNAFADRRRSRRRRGRGNSEPEQLVEAGIDLQDIVERRLVDEGARLFADSFDRLLAGLQKKCYAVAAA
jgi:hypothetical protein